MSTSASGLFMGTSTYSQDLQNVISREVAIASLPITQLQNNVSQLTSQSSELQALSSKFSALQSAISNLSTVAGQMLSVTSSDSSAVQATLGSGVLAGSYSIAVTNLGSYSNALSLDTGLPTVTDPGSQSISASGSYTLSVGTAGPITIQPSGSSLNDLVQAINATDAGVHATVVNVGSGTPDYRLSLQSDQLGDVTMQLNDGHQDLLARTGDAGQPAQYTINGKSIQSGSRSVTLAPGLTVNLTGTTAGVPATITVAPNNTAAGNALSSFATAYNAAVDEINHNRGQAGGALAGQSIVSTLANSLHSLSSYASGSGAISSLTALGLTFDGTTGHLSFDAATFDAATSGQLDALTQFLGAPGSGGFLQMATNTLSGIEDSTSGSLTLAISATLSGISNVNQQISDKQDQITLLQENLTQQMAAADALIASLQQQATYFNNMFTAMQIATNSNSSMASGMTTG